MVHAFLPYYQANRPLGGARLNGSHDHLPYDDLEFFPKLAAVNISWREHPAADASALSFRRGVGCWASPGWRNFEGRHDSEYAEVAREPEQHVTPDWPMPSGFGQSCHFRGCGMGRTSSWPVAVYRRR